MLDSLDLRDKASGIHFSSRKSFAKNRGFRSTNEMQSWWAERAEHGPSLPVRGSTGRDEVLSVNSGDALFLISL